jgi:hypothetical protein
MSSEKDAFEGDMEMEKPKRLSISSFSTSTSLRRSFSRRSKTKTELMRQSIDSKTPLWKADDDDTGADSPWHPKEGKKRSADIDRYLAAESSRLKQHIRILVLGTHGEGQVFWKQTRLLSEPLSRAEKDALRPEVRSRMMDIVTSYMDWFFQRALVELKDPTSERAEAAEYVKQAVRKVSRQEDRGDSARETMSLYRDAKFHEHLGELGLSWVEAEREAISWEHSTLVDYDSGIAGIAAHQLGRILAADYEPTDHDYVHFDNRLYRFRETQLHRGSDHHLHFIDYRFSCCRRKALPELFGAVKCIVYVVDISAYPNTVMPGEDSDSLLTMKLQEFRGLASSRWLHGEMQVVLVLANAAAFRAELEAGKPLSRAFSEYTGVSGGGYDEAIEFVAGRFRDACPAERKGRLHVHVMDEFSAESMEVLIQFMERTALKNMLDEISASPGMRA